jgi:putative ribosome biogenesis GTPase RsgA
LENFDLRWVGVHFKEQIGDTPGIDEIETCFPADIEVNLNEFKAFQGCCSFLANGW